MVFAFFASAGAGGLMPSGPRETPMGALSAFGRVRFDQRKLAWGAPSRYNLQ